MRLELAFLMALVPAVAACGSSADEPTSHGPPPQTTDLFSSVDPRIGTGGIGFGVGSAYPGPALPFAMIHPSPDTRTATGAVDFYHCSGYYADDPLIGGFSLVHFEGTGAQDYGTLSIMPTLGMTDAKRTQAGYMQAFDKGDESSEPGYYGVKLGDGIGVEITSSLHAATFRFAFPAGADPVVLFDLDHRLGGEIKAADVALDPAGATIDAHVQHFGGMSGRAGGYDLHAHGVFDVAPGAVGTFDGAALHAGETSAIGVPLGAFLEFPAGTGSVTLRIAVSFVDADGAKKNLEAEAPSFDFDAMRAEAKNTWIDRLSQVELWGASEYDGRVMATALYHVLLMPTLMSDVDGRYVDVNDAVVSGTRPRYNDFSLWDTYRTLHPWLLFSEDDHAEDFAASLVAMAEEGGAVPVWGIAHGDSHTMIGSPGEIVLAESALKGVHFDDEKAAYELARIAAYGPSPGPVGGRGTKELPPYIALGYVPSDVGASGCVSKTQEYAVADAALGRWAEKLGIASDAAELTERGKSYAALFDPGVGFFRGKKSDGSWAPFGLPTAMDDTQYVEGDAWHYLWMVPQDPDGLAETLGGREAALERLREFFQLSKDEQPIIGVRSHYWPSNEPDIDAPWLFAAWGSPGESYEWVDWAVTALYGDGPDGIPGNDDGGTMSAWLLFAASGLYPIPGSDRYIVAAPRYAKMVLHRASGDLVINASPAPRAGLVPKRVTLDGTALDGTTVTHAQLTGAHVLSFSMGK
jgi:predicted alpha-1,2-mannosidase